MSALSVRRDIFRLTANRMTAFHSVNGDTISRDTPPRDIPDRFREFKKTMRSLYVCEQKR